MIYTDLLTDCNSASSFNPAQGGVPKMDHVDAWGKAVADSASDLHEEAIDIVVIRNYYRS